MVITYVIMNKLEIENYLFDKKTKKEKEMEILEERNNPHVRNKNKGVKNRI